MDTMNQYTQIPAESGAPLTMPNAKRSGIRLICDFLLFFVLILVCVTSFLFFAVPTTEIGGEVYYGETQSILEFAWSADNSIGKELLDVFGVFEGATDESDAATAILSQAMKVFRLAILLAPVLCILLKTAINLLRGAYLLLRGRSAKLGALAASDLSFNLMVYVFFSFFGSLSGGVGEDAYFVGYTVGRGMTAGMVAGVLILLFVALVTLFCNRGKVDPEVDSFGIWVRSLLTVVGCCGVAVFASSLRIYSILMYVFTSSLSSIALTLQSGFEPRSFIFPVLNFILLTICLGLPRRAMRGFNGGLSYMLSYGEPVKESARKRIGKAASRSFIPVAVFSVLALGAVYVLRMPQFGYGWSVDLYWPLVYVFGIAALSQSLCAAFPKKKKEKKAA